MASVNQTFYCFLFIIVKVNSTYEIIEFMNKKLDYKISNRFICITKIKIHIAFHIKMQIHRLLNTCN